MPVLITTVQSLNTLEVFKLTYGYTVRPHKNMPKATISLQLQLCLSIMHKNIDLSALVKAAASNNQVKEVELPRYTYQKLPKHIQKRYQQLLKCNDDFNPYAVLNE